MCIRDRISSEIYGTKEQAMTPNYYIMKLPGENGAEFVNSIPFTPKDKKNLTGLLVARNDGDNYGKLVLYQMPKSKIVYGPMQVEAQIDQNTEISKEFSLWNSSGSSYSRGKMCIRDSHCGVHVYGGLAAAGGIQFIYVGYIPVSYTHLEFEEENLFCPFCGAPVEDVEADLKGLTPEEAAEWRASERDHEEGQAAETPKSTRIVKKDKKQKSVTNKKKKQPKKTKKSSKKPILIAVIIAFVLIGGGVGGYFFYQAHQSVEIDLCD